MRTTRFDMPDHGMSIRRQKNACRFIQDEFSEVNGIAIEREGFDDEL